jgi:hypothetical protein
MDENPFDEPTTIPGLRDPEQIELRTQGDGSYKRDDLRSARGILVAVIIGLAIVAAVLYAVLR